LAWLADSACILAALSLCCASLRSLTSRAMHSTALSPSWVNSLALTSTGMKRPSDATWFAS